MDHTPDDAAPPAPEQALAACREQLAAARQELEAKDRECAALAHNYDTLLRGPFVIFRWVAAEGWPVEYVSENVAQVFGHSAAAFMRGEIAFASVVHPEDLPRVGEEVGMYSAAGVESFEQEYRIVHAGGDVRWVYDFTAVIRNPEGTITHYYGYVLDITASKQRELAAQQHQLSVIAQQSATLAELSTPVLAISETTFVMPMIGAVDSRRIQQIMETLLNGVAERRARWVIVDITGVPLVDTQVASALLRAAQAVGLLGAQVILTGIRPEVAQTLVGLGVDLRGIITRGTLQDGIAHVLQQ